MCTVVTHKEKRRVRFGKEYVQGGDTKGKDLLKIAERHERSPSRDRLRDLDNTVDNKDKAKYIPDKEQNEAEEKWARTKAYRLHQELSDIQIDMKDFYIEG